MQMTDKEIVASYRRCADQSKQVQILAELNACKPSKIKRILAEAGEIALDLQDVAPGGEFEHIRDAATDHPDNPLADRALRCLELIEEADSPEIKKRVAEAAIHIFAADIAAAFNLEVTA